ncbi:MAG: hypothetical protein IJT14_03685 [Rickettsiales bacterium]|nr:hypothetical protein [Rickettsiales bacterium]
MSNYDNNNTTIVNINQHKNVAIKELNKNNKDKNSATKNKNNNYILNVNDIEEVPNNGCCKSCCNKCCNCYNKCTSFVGFPILFIYLVCQACNNGKDVFACQDLKNFSKDISKLFTNDTINSLITNYTSNTSKAALDNFFNAYKKIEKKYKFINLKRDDVEELLATVNNIYSDVQNAEKIAEVGENYFKNAGDQIKKKITQYKNKYREYLEQGNTEINNLTADLHSFENKTSEYLKKYKQNIRTGISAIDSINNNLQNLTQFQSDNVEDLIKNAQSIKKIIENLKTSVKNVHDSVINIREGLPADIAVVNDYIGKFSQHKNIVQNITCELQQDIPNDAVDIENFVHDLTDSGEDLLKDSEDVLSKIYTDINQIDKVFSKAESVIKGAGGLLYEGDKCRALCNNYSCEGSPNAGKIIKASLFGINSLKPVNKQKID